MTQVSRAPAHGHSFAQNSQAWARRAAQNSGLLDELALASTASRNSTLYSPTNLHFEGVSRLSAKPTSRHHLYIRTKKDTHTLYYLVCIVQTEKISSVTLICAYVESSPCFHQHYIFHLLIFLTERTQPAPCRMQIRETLIHCCRGCCRVQSGPNST